MEKNNPFLIVANWKSNLVDINKWKFDVPEKIEVAVAPSFPFLHTVKGFTLCAQDVSAYPPEAYTGEVAAKLLANIGVKYCLVGHSERRKNLHETNFDVEAKMNQAIQNGIIPILCAQTLEEIPENIRNLPGNKFMIMYEPASAISSEGQYHPEAPEKIQLTLSDWQKKLNLSCRFLYGGSVNPDDCSLFIAHCPLVSGFVVGHASLEAESFFAIIKKCLQALPSD